MKSSGYVRLLLSWVAFAPAFLASASAEPVITEFMASNHTNLADEDGAYSDWVRSTIRIPFR